MTRFKVERYSGGKRVPDKPYVPGMYGSKPGDARRQGRVEAERGVAASVALKFIDAAGRVDCMLGVVMVAQITINPTGGFLWACFLPMLRPQPQPAADLEKAKSAVDFKVREWCEAARLVTRGRR